MAVVITLDDSNRIYLLNFRPIQKCRKKFFFYSTLKCNIITVLNDFTCSCMSMCVTTMCYDVFIWLSQFHNVSMGWIAAWWCFRTVTMIYYYSLCILQSCWIDDLSFVWAILALGRTLAHECIGIIWLLVQLTLMVLLEPNPSNNWTSHRLI